GVDADCAGNSDYDADADGYNSDSYGGADCNDTAVSIYPGAPDTWYDGIDSDCAGDSDYDADLDGYNSDAFGGADCDDTNIAVNPSEVEVWYDGLDADCDGLSDYDADLDGYDSDAYGGADCDDSAIAVNPSEAEVCDSVDNDCDGDVDEDDGSGGSCGLVLEDFEGGAWTASGWTAVASGGSISSSTVYEGSYAVVDPGWHYNTEETLSVGDTVSTWTYPGSGRSYLGFNSSSSGTYSFVLAPNTSDIRFQINSGWGYNPQNIQSYSVPSGQWLRMEVELVSTTEVVGRIYNTSGTMLTSLSQSFSTDISGGYVAIRGFSTTYFDYIEIY
ncbi:MAG TPA: hypothetical protein DFR83_10060, partial [Deltaproteobacteria bacterium]|nr:hypothetical protein [Deltaproteobacteria bacterium]